MLEQTAASSAALAEELRNMIDHAERLLHAMGADGDEAISALRERVHGAMDTAKNRLSALEQQARHSTQRIATVAETYIREHPWTSIGIAIGAGLLLGSLLLHRSTDE